MSSFRTSSGKSTTPFRPPGPAKPSAQAKTSFSSDDEFGTFISDEDLQPLDIPVQDLTGTSRPPTAARPSNAPTATTRQSIPSDPPSLRPSSPPVVNAAPVALSDDIPGIPPALLTRIAHTHFRHPDTGISAGGQAALARYVDVFVREALARAAQAQRQRTGESGEVWVDAQDLEEVVPGLLLDF